MVENDLPVKEQSGPPPFVEELCDTNDLPEGFSTPPQTPVPDDSIYEEEVE